MTLNKNINTSLKKVERRNVTSTECHGNRKALPTVWSHNVHNVLQVNDCYQRTLGNEKLYLSQHINLTLSNVESTEAKLKHAHVEQEIHQPLWGPQGLLIKSCHFPSRQYRPVDRMFGARHYRSSNLHWNTSFVPFSLVRAVCDMLAQTIKLAYTPTFFHTDIKVYHCLHREHANCRQT